MMCSVCNLNSQPDLYNHTWGLFSYPLMQHRPITLNLQYQVTLEVRHNKGFGVVLEIIFLEIYLQVEGENMSECMIKLSEERGCHKARQTAVCNGVS